MPHYSRILGIFLVLLSLFYGCSREDKEENVGSDNSLPPESFRIFSVEPEDDADQVFIQTSLKVFFNSEIDQETIYPGSILLVQNSTFIQRNHEVHRKRLIFQPQNNLSNSITYQFGGERNPEFNRSDAGDHHQDDFQDRSLCGPHPAQVASGHSPGQCLRGGNGFFHRTDLQ